MNTLKDALIKFDTIEVQREHIAALLNNIGDARCAKKPELNKWSINEVIGHLLMAERLSVHYVNKKKLALKMVGKAGCFSLLRLVLLELVLLLPLRYKAPENAHPNVQGQSTTDLLIAWGQQRQTLKKLLKELEGHLDKALFKHPFAGRMSLMHMMVFYHRHTEHHLAQIQRINKSIEV